MKFSMHAERARTTIKAAPGESDGVPPVPCLEVGTNLDEVTTADRLAVGLALIYSPWLSGSMETPELVSVLTAQRVSEFFAERFVTVTSVAPSPQQLPRGVAEVRVVDLARQATTGGSGDPRIEVAPFSMLEGAVTRGLRQSVATNVHLFAGPPTAAWAGGLNILGLGVLLAENADASVLVHSAATAGIPRLAPLLESVGLGLSAPR